MVMWLVLVCLVVGAVSQQSNITVIPSPSSCAYHASLSASYASPGFIIVDISSSYSNIDTLSVARCADGEDITIATSAYSNTQMDTTSVGVSNSSHYSTLIYSLNYNGFEKQKELDAACPKRLVVTVTVPDSVQFVCWNGECFCNCAVKGAGVNIHFTNPLAGEMDMLSAAGFGYARMDFEWAAIEQTKGRYDWDTYDVLVSSLAPYNVTPYLIFDYYNSFYDNGTSPTDREGDVAFASFAVNSTMRYAGKGFVWELYNEPNWGFWKPKPNVTQYLALGLEVGSRLKAATPQEIFVGPAVANVGSGPDGLDIAFLTTCFAGGMLEYWDAISFHPYRQSAPETVIDEFRAIRQLINTYKPSSKGFVGLISGEWGYSTTWGNIDNNTQGEYIVREMMYNLGNEVPVSIWYDWHDDGTDPTNAEHNFGTTFNPYYPNRNPCYDPKPSYTSRLTMQSQIGGKHFNKRIWVNSDDVFVMLFNTAGKEDYVIAAWTTNANNYTIQIPSSSSSTFQVVTLYGASTYSVSSLNGYVEVLVTTEPLYMTATSPNALLSLIGASTRLLPEYIATYGWLALTWNVPNPTSSNISVGLNGSLSVPLSPGDTAVFTQEILVTRQPLFTDVIFLISTSIGSFNISTAIGSSEPLILYALPASLDQINITLSNPAGSAFQGYITMATTGAHGKTNQTQKLVMTDGETFANIPFAVDSGNITGLYSLNIQVLDLEYASVLSAVNSYQMMDDYSKFPEGTTPKPFTVVNDGDPKVPANFSLVAETPSDGPQDISSIALHYYMGAGWKFLWVSPEENNVINTLPVAMGCWIFASSQMDYARVRVVDATGQTFQLTYAQLNWSGWQYVTLQFTAGTTYWGGANDGQFHLPLKIGAVFLLDSSQTANEGVVYFTPPVLIF